jgi:hypothetical protein
MPIRRGWHPLRIGGYHRPENQGNPLEKTQRMPGSRKIAMPQTMPNNLALFANPGRAFEFG